VTVYPYRGGDACESVRAPVGDSRSLVVLDCPIASERASFIAENFRLYGGLGDESEDFVTGDGTSGVRGGFG
jgi:hypothetical protein